MTAAGRRENPIIRLLSDPLDTLWRILRAPATALFLLSLLALVTLLGQALPQIPPEALSDPARHAGWLAEQPAFLRPQMGWLQSAGLLTLYQTIGFRLLLALFALALLIVTADGLLRLWGFLRRPAARPTGPILTQECAGAPGETARRLRRDLWRRGFLVALTHDEETGAIGLRAIRLPVASLCHLGALIALAGLLLNATFGWQVASLPLLPDTEQALGDGRYTLSLGQQGTSITLMRQGRPLAEVSALSDTPLRHLGLTILPLSAGPLVRVAGSAQDGRPLRLEAYPRTGESSSPISLAFGAGQAERYFRVQDSGRVYRLTLDGETLGVEVYPRGESTPASRHSAGGGQTLDLDGERLTFTLERYRIVSARSDPAWGVVLGGLIGLLAGLVLAALWPAARLDGWLAACPTGTAFGLCGEGALPAELRLPAQPESESACDE